MAINLAYYITMKVANIAQFKNNLSKFISQVEQGETIEICKRNIPIAHLVPVATKQKKNHTKLGCGRKSVKIKGDLTQPMIPEEAWEMLQI